MSFSADVKKELSESYNAHKRCRSGELQQAFLECGSISDPGKGYHLEFVCENEPRSARIKELLSDFGITAGISRRKGRFVVYVKDGDSVSDILGIIGATNSLLRLENERVLHDISGRVNRRVNCEASNLRKTVVAGQEQLRHIAILKKKHKFAGLPPELLAAAQLRIDHPDLSIAELGAMLTPPLGKSGIYHRFERIKLLAEEAEKT